MFLAELGAVLDGITAGALKIAAELSVDVDLTVKLIRHLNNQ